MFHQVTGAYSVNETDVENLAIVASQQDNVEQNLEAFWQSLEAAGKTAVPFTVSTSGSQTIVCQIICTIVT